MQFDIPCVYPSSIKARISVMLRKKATHLLAIGLVLLIAPWSAWAQIHHELYVTLNPATHHIAVVDTISLPENYPSPITFRLHSGLRPKIKNPGMHLRQLHKTAVTEKYAVDLDAPTRQFTVEYGGEIFHPVAETSEEYARSFSVSPGLIAPEGVFLAGQSFWYPRLDDKQVIFSLAVQLPLGWRSVSQGKRTRHSESHGGTEETWIINAPQEEIYLVAGPFIEYCGHVGKIETMAFLRQRDRALARKYLDATKQYIRMYRQLIGHYPYSKFALVENFWETGYGMPSFTLLGSRVIRFPFILRTSYPHEILHNWWGNGVYVDYASGNWAEGLTSYLADHLLKEQQGQAVEYRRETLQKYTNYVREGLDFPLSEFRSRHSAATQAVGYGKAMMLFHMLRRQLGDATFVKALQRFYRQYLFEEASFDEVAETFSEVSGQPLTSFFKQWVERTGAPFLRVGNVEVTPSGRDYLLRATIEQIQPGKSYQLQLPIAVYMAGMDNAYQTRVTMTKKTQQLELRLPRRPLQLDVDPRFDVFRRLHRNEIPPALSEAFGAARALVVLPSGAPKAMRKGYAALARAWQRGRGEHLEITTDAALSELPNDRAIWLFGWANRFRPALNQALAEYAYKANEGRVKIAGTELQRGQHSVVVVARQPENPAHALAWVATGNVAAMLGLARKLPHYGKYSYLGFAGDEPENMFKGQWPVVNSPMSILLTDKPVSLQAELAPREPLIELPPLFKSERMMQDIAYLAAPKLEGRGLGTLGLDQAARYIADAFQAAGLEPAGEAGTYYQIWTAEVGKPKGRVTLRNVVGVLPGTHPELPTLIIGAHYDHLGRGWPDVHQGDAGKIHPGADDNASGIAVMLELARVLGAQWQPKRSVVFIAFTGEEAGRLGSIHYLQQLGSDPANHIMAMINLDSVGRLGAGDLLVLGAGSAQEWTHIFRGADSITGVPIKTVAHAIGSSDHTSFLEAGIPAVQLFTGPHADYHRPTDTIDKIDASGLAKVAAVLKEAVEYLAFRTEPLSWEQPAGDGKSDAEPAQTRQVTLGSVPDFAWEGRGVRLSGIMRDTPAAAVGLRAGDIIIRLNGADIDTLADFASILRKLEPGDSLSIEFLRDQKRQTVTAQVIAR
ncbi:MAG: M20/M25/M40 family metallo-hydrolase [Nitrococcus sp.]|nr:M20/M25/M40 family metallo-hydrolase [Nitrococcus sp.]